MNRQVEANLSMVVSKALGGLNMNALKYLLPLWIAPVTGVTFRLVFGAAAFWLIDIFCKPENSTIRQKWQLFILGALGIYGYMFFYLLGISKNYSGFQFYFCQFGAYMGIHYLCIVL